MKPSHWLQLPPLDPPYQQTIDKAIGKRGCPGNLCVFRNIIRIAPSCYQRVATEELLPSTDRSRGESRNAPVCMQLTASSYLSAPAAATLVRR